MHIRIFIKRFDFSQQIRLADLRGQFDAEGRDADLFTGPLFSAATESEDIWLYG